MSSAVVVTARLRARYLDPVVQNSTKLLVNMKLKFLNCMANTLIFFAEKWKLLTFLQQSINVFENTLATTVNEFVMNKLVKLMML